jgi:hypothetical protein
MGYVMLAVVTSVVALGTYLATGRGAAKAPPPRPVQHSTPHPVQRPAEQEREIVRGARRTRPGDPRARLEDRRG